MPRNLGQLSPRLDLENTYRAFFPVLPVDPIDSISGAWSDTTLYDMNQSGIRMNIQRINNYIAQGQETYEGWEALRIDYTSEVWIDGDGTQQASSISLSGMGTGQGSFYFFPERGLFLGGEETSQISMQAFVARNGQNEVIPIDQRREEIIKLMN